MIICIFFFLFLTLPSFPLLRFSPVSYVRRTSQHQWRCSDVTFHCANQGLCEQWVQLINEQLSLLSMFIYGCPPTDVVL